MNPILKVFCRCFQLFFSCRWSYKAEAYAFLFSINRDFMFEVKNQTTTTPVYKTWTCLHIELDIIWKLSSHSLQSYETQVVMTFIEWNTAQNASNLEGVF